MTLVDSRPAAWLARRSSVEVVRRVPANAPKCDDSGRNDDAQRQYSLPAEGLGCLPRRCIMESN